LDLEQIESWDASYSGTQNTHRTGDGVELYYEHRGEGPWLAILSGVFVVSTAWRNFTRQLVATSTVLNYDIRNQGASGSGDGSYENHLSDLTSLLDGLGVEETYIMGVSFSSLFARDFTIENPDRVKGLILCGPALSPYGSKRRNHMVKGWLAALEAGGPAGLFDSCYPFLVGDRTIARGGSAAYLALRERFLAISSKGQLRANLEGALEADDDRDKLRQVQGPVLLMTGDNGFSIGRSGLEDLAALIPDVQVEIIDRCGHGPYVEATDEFEAIVQAFLIGVENRRTAAPSA